MNLEPMSPENYEVYLERLIVEYAEDKLGAGNWSEEVALTRSRDEITKLLSEGVFTPGQALFDLTVPDETEPVGVLWLSALADAGAGKGFVHDIWIRPEMRRKGLGAMAMIEAERWAKSQGFSRLSLHVFWHNQAAFAMYEKLGYEITNVNMTKQLS